MRSDRPEFQRLQADLASGRFDIVLAESLDRISRSMKDTAGFYQIADFHGVRIVTLDAGEIDKLRIGITSTMAEMFIDNLRAKTHRGVKARVESGRSGGGRAFGYRPIKAADEAGAMEIIVEEADVVRRIFRDYADGLSPLKIAAALNAEGVPSPRVGKGSGHWKQNTINGNRERGTGILNNELYIGQRVWNRLEYRKDPGTSKRVSRLRPEHEWIRHAAPDLRIIDDALWAEVKARQASQTRSIRKAEGAGRKGLGARGVARRRKYLLSGLLECACCGGSLIIAGQGSYKRYYCANAKEKGPAVCAGMPGLSRSEAEALILSGLRDGLMTDTAIEQFRKDFARHVAEQSKGATERIERRKVAVWKLEEARKNYKTAIGAGHINPTILEGLSETEAQLAALASELEQEAGEAFEIPADLGALYRSYVDDLAQTLSAGEVVGRASDEIHGMVDRIVVSWDDASKAHELALEGDLVALLSAAAKEKAASYDAAGSSLRLVAGTGFEHRLASYLQCANELGTSERHLDRAGLRRVASSDLTLQEQLM